MTFSSFIRSQFSLPAFVQAFLLGLLAFGLTNMFMPVEEFEVKDALFPVAVFTYVYIKNGTSMADMPSDKKLEEQQREEDKRDERTMKAPRLGPRSISYVRGEAPQKESSDSVVVLFVFQTWCKHCAKTFGPIIGTTKAFKGLVKTIALTTNNEEEIEAFLSNNKIAHLEVLCNAGNFAMGVDGSNIIKSLQGFFEVTTIPHVYVVRGSEVVWEGHPTGLEGVLGWYLNEDEEES